MILSVPKFDINLEMKENQVNVLVIEKPEILSMLLEDILLNSGNAFFSLYDGEKILNVEKNLECIINPFEVDCNDRKIVTKIYQYLKNDSELLFQTDTEEIKTILLQYLDKIVSMSSFNLDYDCELDVVELYKALGIRIINDFETLYDRLVEYTHLKQLIFGTNIFVFVNLKQFLNENEIAALYKKLLYEKINVVIIDSHEYKKLENEVVTIIDKDQCMIRLD